MKAMALDIGLKRIGIAFYTDKIAIPLKAVLRKNRNQAAREIKVLIQDYQISKLIIGIPKGGSAQEQMDKRIKHFVSLLDFQGELDFIDESMSSKEALKLQNTKSKKKDGKLDSLAAFLMLKEYFKI